MSLKWWSMMPCTVNVKESEMSKSLNFNDNNIPSNSNQLKSDYVNEYLGTTEIWYLLSSGNFVFLLPE